MKKYLIVIGIVIAVVLPALVVYAAEDASWGTIKEQVRKDALGPIAKPVQTAAAAARPMLVGTTGQGWAQPSVLYEIDPTTGSTIREIGPVGYIVNGMGV